MAEQAREDAVADVLGATRHPTAGAAQDVVDELADEPADRRHQDQAPAQDERERGEPLPRRRLGRRCQVLRVLVHRSARWLSPRSISRARRASASAIGRPLNEPPLAGLAVWS